MWAWISTALSAFKGLFTGASGGVLSYIVVALGAVIVVLVTMIYANRSQINELHEQVNQGQVALEYQNVMIENNRVKNEALNKELQSYVEKVKKDFANIKTPEAYHKEAQNSCEAWVKEVAEAYQK